MPQCTQNIYVWQLWIRNNIFWVCLHFETPPCSCTHSVGRWVSKALQTRCALVCRVRVWRKLWCPSWQAGVVTSFRALRPALLFLKGRALFIQLWCGCEEQGTWPSLFTLLAEWDLKDRPLHPLGSLWAGQWVTSSGAERLLTVPNDRRDGKGFKSLGERKSSTVR